MLILAFDTAVAACSAAVWRDGAVLARVHETMERGHAEALVPRLAAVMKTAAIEFDQLDRIAVTVGPGSFTGVRVGLSTARGLALPLAIPVIGMTTGTVLARQAAATGDGTIISLIDSKRGDLYVEVFDHAGIPRHPAVVMPRDEIASWVAAQTWPRPVTLVGDGE